jgi:Ca-activated chloride channel family protein
LHLAAADAPRDLIQRGNDHYQAGRYAEALEAYEQAGEEYGDVITAELLHNQAAAHFKLGQIDEARELWVRAATLEDALFEATARYNLGNCDYADALRAVENQDVPGALELLDRAGAQYRDAVRLDPGLTNARANLELAEMLKEQIKQQTTTQPQSQPSSQPQQQQQQDQSSSQPSSQPSQQGDQNDQSDQSSATQPTSQPEQQPQTQPSQQPESQPDQQQQDQPSPTSQPRESPQTQPADAQPQDRQPVELRMTPEEAERLLQMIRDAEQARRRVLRQREAARHKPVERDW